MYRKQLSTILRTVSVVTLIATMTCVVNAQSGSRNPTPAPSYAPAQSNAPAQAYDPAQTYAPTPAYGPTAAGQSNGELAGFAGPTFVPGQSTCPSCQAACPVPEPPPAQFYVYPNRPVSFFHSRQRNNCCPNNAPPGNNRFTPIFGGPRQNYDRYYARGY